MYKEKTTVMKMEANFVLVASLMVKTRKGDYFLNEKARVILNTFYSVLMFAVHILQILYHCSHLIHYLFK